MQTINQIFMILLAVILLGILSSSTYKTVISLRQEDRNLWPVSIVSRVGAFFAWALSPLVGIVALELANILFVASVFSLVLFIRSWRRPVSLAIKKALLILLIIFSAAFGWLLSLPDSLPYRFALTSSVVLFASCWGLYESYKKSQVDESYLLKILVGVSLIEIALAIFSIARALMTTVLNMPSIMHAESNQAGIIFMWITFSVHLLSYIVINSYLYEKLWKSERETHDALRQNQIELTQTTREKEQIEELLNEREQLIAGLVKANKTASTGAMAASIAHEMAQPLAVIQINSEFLEKLNQEGKLQPEITEEMLSGILASNRHAGNIVKTLRGIFLDNSPIFERTNLQQLVESVVQLARTKLDQKGISLVVNIPDDLEADLYANEIFQVLINLINNSVQALSDKVPGQGCIIIDGFAEAGNLFLIVKDNGPGISPAMVDQLFKLFANSGKPESMGLGLWLCAYIVQRHRGGIWQENDPEGGAQFFIRIPLKAI